MYENIYADNSHPPQQMLYIIVCIYIMPGVFKWMWKSQWSVSW